MPVERMYLERYAKLRAKLPEISKVTHTHSAQEHTHCHWDCLWRKEPNQQELKMEKEERTSFLPTK